MKRIITILILATLLMALPIFPSGAVGSTFAISNVYYAESLDTILIKGLGFGESQGTNKVFAGGKNFGAAIRWSDNVIYFNNLLEKPDTILVSIDGEEQSSSVEDSPFYSPYPYDIDINNPALVSYWPFDSNYEDVKYVNNGINRGTILRPESIFGSALQPSQILGFEENRYVAFGGLLKLNNGDIIDVYRNSNTHGYTNDSRLEIIRSTDGGYTWSDPEIILQIPGYDVGGGGVLIQLQNGDILCISLKRTIDREYFDPVVIASTDNGYTWSQRSTVTDNQSGITTGGAYGYPIQLENGRILISCDTTNHPDNDGNRSRVVFYSDDDGYSWHYLSVILHELPYEEAPTTNTTQAYSAGATEIMVADASSFPESGMVHITDGVDEEHFTYGYKDGNTLKNIYDNSLYVESGINNDYNSGATVKWWPRAICETQISKAPDDNNLYAIIRHNGFGAAPGNRILYSRSTDQGATWTQAGVLYFNRQTSAPITGQGFRMYLSQEDRLYLLYRWNGTKSAYSDDNGQTWTGDNSGRTFETTNYYLNNNNGAYASYAEFDDKLLVQSYRDYGTYVGGGKREHAYIEKAYIYKDNPDKIGNFVQVPADSSLQLDEFSIEFWVRMDEHYENLLNTNQVILAKRDASEYLRDNCNYIFKLLDPTGVDANKIEFGVRDSSGNYKSVKSNSALERGGWYYVAGTYNGQTMHLYVDGLLQDSLDTDLTPLENSPLNIGIYSVHQDWYTADKKFQGQIDNLKIWKDALDESKILNNANYSSFNSAENLILHYKFNEGSGGITADGVRNNDGAIYGATWVDGISDKALSFDGYDDSVISNSPPFPDTDPDQLSVSTWFKAETLGKRVYDFNVDPLFLFITPSGGVEMTLWNKAGESITLKAPAGTIQTEEWYHVVITHEPFKTKLWINGEEVDSSNILGGNIRAKKRFFRIGGREGSGGGYKFFDGIIDEIRLYNRSLAKEEVEALYETNKPKGPILHYKFNEGSGGITADGVRNNDGAIYGATWVDGISDKALSFDGYDDSVISRICLLLVRILKVYLLHN